MLLHQDGVVLIVWGEGDITMKRLVPKKIRAVRHRALTILVSIGILCGPLLLTGCEQERELGPCIGLVEERDPRLMYEWSARNISLGLLFASAVFPLVYVILKQAQCPMAQRYAGPTPMPEPAPTPAPHGQY